MSRVTIGKLAGDFNSATFQERQKTKDIEVVPRKVVEDIIGYGRSFNGSGIATSLVDFAEKCLKAFEEGEEA